jgi:8-oxo-dGTP diphosphatase
MLDTPYSLIPIQPLNTCEPNARIQVAVGVVHHSDGRVLFAQRPSGKPYAGWWEFPGGKLEAGETVAHALTRELREELGIQILDCAVWLHQHYDYEHAAVQLHMCNVRGFKGELQSLENQAFQWGYAHQAPQPFLPAALPVLKALQLPSIIYAGHQSHQLALGLPNQSQWHCDSVDLLHTLKDRSAYTWLSAKVTSVDDIAIAHAMGCDFITIRPSSWGSLSEILTNTSVAAFVDLAKLTAPNPDQALLLAQAAGALGIVLSVD